MVYENYLTVAVITLYALGTLGQFLSILSRRWSVRVIADWLTIAGFTLHTVFAASVFFSYSLQELSSSYFIQLLAWGIILAFLAVWLLFRLRILGLTAAPLALLLCIFSLKYTGGDATVLPESLVGLFFTLHISALIVSGALMALAFGAGLLFVYMNRKLKQKSAAKDFSQDMPSLAAFDAINKYAVTIGFPLYTIGLMSGFIWTPLLAQAFGSPKVLISLVVWAMYALLFYQRLALGFRGRKTAVMAIIIFALSALSFGIDYSLSHHSSMLQS